MWSFVSGFGDAAGPTTADLAAIEAEQPLLAAELDWLDAEIQCLDARPTDIARTRVRQAEREVIREMLCYVASRCRAETPPARRAA